MKIEIGESLVYSWLRHIESCQIVQVNWKTSPKWPQVDINSQLQAMMDRVNVEFDYPFKKTKHISQLFKQAEIDAIGIDIRNNSICAVDISFHEGGLSYGDKFETSKRVTKKILRTIFILLHYFGDVKNHKVVFISPKINPEPLSILTASLEQVSKYLISESINCEVELICNTKFKDTILDPVSSLASNVADTSELFLRSIQLVKMFPVNESAVRSQLVEREVNQNEITSEINKVTRKIPNWFISPNQINSTILISYLELLNLHGDVTLTMLREACGEIADFQGNYNQMKNFGENNHAKVFQEFDGVVTLWEPVKEFVLDQYLGEGNV